MWAFLHYFLDRTILFSFDRTGYWRHIKLYPEGDRLSFEKKCIWISGATGGLGRALSEELDQEGWELLLPCRCQSKGSQLLSQLTHKHTLDSLNLSCAKEVLSYTPSKKPFVMIHNAGAMPNQKQLNDSGMEEIFATQVVAPFILTMRGIEEGFLKSGARVIFVSSGGMYAQKLSLTDLNFERRPYNKYIAYANAKRAQVILAELFAQKYPEYHFAAMHPGWVKTPGVYHSMRWFYYLVYPILRTPKEGVDTLLFLIRSKKWSCNGAFWFDRHRVSPYVSEKTKSAPEEKEALWNFCMEQRKLWQSLS